MAIRVELYLALTHIALGIGLPVVYLVLKSVRRSATQRVRHAVGGWIVTSWGFFFAGTVANLIFNVVFAHGLAGFMVGVLVGVVPFTTLSLLAFRLARFQWKLRSES